MISRLIQLSIKNRWLLVAIVAAFAAFGMWNLVRMPIDAVPDITNRQVQVNTVEPSLGPTEIERRVTFPIETALAGITGLDSTRSISRNGFSQVTAVFRDDVDIYFARQQVQERLRQAADSLPSGVEPQMGPITTGLGEVVMWTIRFQPRPARTLDGRPGWQSDGSFLTSEGERLTDDIARGAYLRTVQDWIVRPQLRTVPGVAGVDSIGGYEKQYVVEPDPARLASYGISFSELAQALEAANTAVGANFVERSGEALLVRADARIRNVDEIGRAVVATREGVPVTVNDLAAVRIGGAIRTGAASENGQEAVVGTALMLIGENSRTVASAVTQRLRQVSRTLPAGIQAEVVYDRSALVQATISTVERNLVEGALLVIVSLFLLLGNIRAAIITALVIPLSMLFLAIGMNRLGVSGNLMSLGALDFGLIVDGTVIIVENCLRKLAERQHHEGRLLNRSERFHEVFEGAREMVRPTIFGQAIIFLVFAPLLTFQGVEGKMFSPMAIAVILALLGAFILSLTFVPAMIALVMTGKVSEKEARLIAIPKRWYEPLLKRAVARPIPVILAGVLVFAISGFAFTRLGSEFIPTLDEQDLSIQALRIPSTSLNQSRTMQLQVEQALSAFPQVRFVYSKTGTAEVASDPMPPNASDTFVILRPRSEWPNPGLPKAELVEQMEQRLQQLVGNAYEFSQPIQMRFNELIAGVRGDVAIKVYGDDLDSLSRSATQIATILNQIPGAADVKVEQTGGFPTLDVVFDREAIARYGLRIEDVSDTVAASLGGREAGLVFEGDRRFDIVVRVPDSLRNNLDAVGALPVMLPERSGVRQSIPLRELVRFNVSDGLNQISRENGRRRVVIAANVRGADVGAFVRTAQERVEREVRLPTGASIEWSGQFQNLQQASARMGIVLPAAGLLIFALLFMALGQLRAAVAVFAAVPLALAGGVFALVVTGLPFSVSAAVGFICLSGVAVLNGLVMMSSILARLDQGLNLVDSIVGGATERFRAVLMTAIVPSLGFVPMAIGSGTGAEVQKPLAIVVIGGLMTATVLILFVLPAICRLLLRPGHVARPGEVPTAYSPEALVPAE